MSVGADASHCCCVGGEVSTVENDVEKGVEKDIKRDIDKDVEK